MTNKRSLILATVVSLAAATALAMPASACWQHSHHVSAPPKVVKHAPVKKARTVVRSKRVSAPRRQVKQVVHSPFSPFAAARSSGGDGGGGGGGGGGAGGGM